MYFNTTPLNVLFGQGPAHGQLIVAPRQVGREEGSSERSGGVAGRGESRKGEGEKGAGIRERTKEKPTHLVSAANAPEFPKLGSIGFTGSFTVMPLSPPAPAPAPPTSSACEGSGPRSPLSLSLSFDARASEGRPGEVARSFPPPPLPPVPREDHPPSRAAGECERECLSPPPPRASSRLL